MLLVPHLWVLQYKLVFLAKSISFFETNVDGNNDANDNNNADDDNNDDNSGIIIFI